MRAVAASVRRRAGGRPLVGLLLAGFALAVGVRLALGGVAVRDSTVGGLAFAACLTALSVATGARLRPSRRAAAIGIGGGAVLCLSSLLRQLPSIGAHRPAGSFLGWAVIVAVVAVAEELFLRGALFEAVSRRSGPLAAVAVSAGCFGLLHVPLYGWSAVPLDLAVGGWLGVLRLEADSPTAPAVAHVIADVAGWWLR